MPAKRDPRFGKTMALSLPVPPSPPTPPFFHSSSPEAAADLVDLGLAEAILEEGVDAMDTEGMVIREVVVVQTGPRRSPRKVRNHNSLQIRNV